MTWTPTLAIITPRAVPVNLLTYVTDSTRQTDALTWAGDSSLKLIKTFSNSVANRAIPVFPSIAFSDDNDIEEFGEDTVTAAYAFTFEVSIQNADPDTAVTNARVYDKALRSMIVNCPSATLGTNTGCVSGTAAVQTIETGFEPIKTNEKQNDFLQQFQIRVTVTMVAPANI